MRAIGVPLVSEHPAGKIRHHPERLAAAITALAQGKLGAWRSRAEARRHVRCTNGFISFANARSRSARIPNTCIRAASIRRRSSYLRYGLESQAGFVVITGEIGSGKTTLLQTLLRNLDSQTTVGRIVNTMLEPRELLETIMIDFGLDPTRPEQAAAAPRSRAVSRRSASRRPAGAAGHRRSAEPQPRRARRAADAVEPRDREIEAAADRAGRPAQSARQAAMRPNSSNSASASPSAITCRRSTQTRRCTTSTIGSGVRRSARRSSFRRTRPPSSTRAAAACRGSSTSSAMPRWCSAMRKSAGRSIAS